MPGRSRPRARQARGRTRRRRRRRRRGLRGCCWRGDGGARVRRASPGGEGGGAEEKEEGFRVEREAAARRRRASGAEEGEVRVRVVGRETRRAVVRRDRDGGAAQGERRGAREAVARVQQAVQGVGAGRRATGARETSDEGASALVNDRKDTCIYKSTKKYFFRPRGFRTGFGRHDPRFVGCVLKSIDKKSATVALDARRRERGAFAEASRSGFRVSFSQERFSALAEKP